MKAFGSKTFLAGNTQTRQDEDRHSGQLLSELTPMDGTHWKLCLHPLEHKRSFNPDLSTLLESPSATNVFFDPAILSASRDRITQSRIYQLVLWEKLGDQALPRLSIPMIEDHGTLWQQTILRSFTHPYAPLGNALIADDTANPHLRSEITERMIELLAIAFNHDLPPLVLDYMDVSSPLAVAFNNIPQNGAIAAKSVAMDTRASITVNNGMIPDLPINKKRQREYRRLERKLGDLGTVTYEKAADPFEVLLRLEEYLLMETRGWKGRRGTSIHAIKRDAAFARQSVTDLAKEGRSEVFTLRVNNVAIASIILFRMNGSYYPWKICFNESFARYSPGTLLMLKLTDDITSRDDFRHADSLAHFGHSWMTALWPSENRFQTIVLARELKTANGIVERITLSGRSKNFVKRLLRRK